MSNNTIDRDERHPLMNPPTPTIDNDAINNIINSIIKANKSNNTLSHGSTQYLLPVDLLVSVDNSTNTPTVQAALPSSFAIQQSLIPFQFPNITPTVTPSMTPNITPNCIPNISIPRMLSPLPPLPPKQLQSSLNPSAPSFTPYTAYTPMAIQPIIETENDSDEWCQFDRESLRTKVHKKETKIGHSNSDPKTVETAKFKPNKRALHLHSREYNRNWRNHSNDSHSHTMQMRWRNNNRNMHVSYRFQKYDSIKHNGKPNKLLAEFVRHVTLPNRNKYPPNTLLTKTWAMRNCGMTEWGSCVELVYCKGAETLSLHHRYPVINAQSGQEIEISANIKTPVKSGRYCTYFRLQKNGRFFGPRVWVDVIVSQIENEINPLRITNKCAQQIEKSGDIIKINGGSKVNPQKANKWKKKYGTKNEAHNHYKVVSCK